VTVCATDRYRMAKTALPSICAGLVSAQSARVEPDRLQPDAPLDSATFQWLAALLVGKFRSPRARCCRFGTSQPTILRRLKTLFPEVQKSIRGDADSLQARPVRIAVSTTGCAREACSRPHSSIGVDADVRVARSGGHQKLRQQCLLMTRFRPQVSYPVIDEPAEHDYAVCRTSAIFA
jgi:hypothetical protein